MRKRKGKDRPKAKSFLEGSLKFLTCVFGGFSFVLRRNASGLLFLLTEGDFPLPVWPILHKEQGVVVFFWRWLAHLFLWGTLFFAPLKRQQARICNLSHFGLYFGLFFSFFFFCFQSSTSSPSTNGKGKGGNGGGGHSHGYTYRFLRWASNMGVIDNLGTMYIAKRHASQSFFVSRNFW